MMDIGVGRLPAKSEEEARIFVDKLHHYATDPNTFGSWRNELIFVADDGDFNLHQRDADRLAVYVDTTYRAFNVNKIYVDAFEQEKTSIRRNSDGGQGGPSIDPRSGRPHCEFYRSWLRNTMDLRNDTQYYHDQRTGKYWTNYRYS